MSSQAFPSLRATLALDALACLARGAGLARLAPVLAGLADLSPASLRASGLALLPIGIFTPAMGLRREVPAWVVSAIVAGHSAWVVPSVALPLSGLVRPSALGLALVLGQAAAVAALAELDWARRSGAQGPVRAA